MSQLVLTARFVEVRWSSSWGDLASFTPAAISQTTNLAVKTSWLILDLDFFHFRLSFGYFLFERSVKLNVKLVSKRFEPTELGEIVNSLIVEFFPGIVNVKSKRLETSLT